MASTYITPGGAGANLAITAYERRILGALYDRMKFTPLVDKTVMQVMDSLILRRMGRIPVQQLSSTENGTGFDFSDVSPTQVTLTPQWILAAAAMPDSMARRGGNEIPVATADGLDATLSSGLDNYHLQVINACTTTKVGATGTYDIVAADLRTLLGTLDSNSYGNATAGNLNLILQSTQIGPALAIPEITNAYQRGDGTSPNVTGRMANGLGFKFAFTTNCYHDATGYYGAAFKSAACSQGYAKTPGPEKQRYMKQNRYMADADTAIAMVYNELMVPIVTQ